MKKTLKNILNFISIIVLTSTILCSCQFDNLFCVHQWSDWKIVDQPNCTTLGKIERECLLCEGKDYEDIATSPHDYKDDICTYCGFTNESYFDFTYLDDTNSYSISAKDDVTLPDLIIIPGMYNGKPVTHISAYAFSYNKEIKNVVISKNITTIGDYAFWVCTELRTVYIGEDVTVIGQNAFRNCSKLYETLYLTNTTYIGGGAFSFCGMLEGVVLGENLTHIGPEAFINCAKIEEVTIPKNVTFIGSRAFERCESLNSVEFASENGWKAIDMLISENEISLSALDLADSKKAAVFLVHTYSAYYWNKN